jgi:hypothetical protein
LPGADRPDVPLTLARTWWAGGAIWLGRTLWVGADPRVLQKPWDLGGKGFLDVGMPGVGGRWVMAEQNLGKGGGGCWPPNATLREREVEKPGSGPGAKGYDQPKKQPGFWHRWIPLNKALFVTHAYVVSIVRFSGQPGGADAAPGRKGRAG